MAFLVWASIPPFKARKDRRGIRDFSRSKDDWGKTRSERAGSTREGGRLPPSAPFERTGKIWVQTTKTVGYFSTGEKV